MIERNEKIAFGVMVFSASLLALLLLAVSFNGIVGNVVITDEAISNSGGDSFTSQDGVDSGCTDGTCDAVLVTKFRYINNGGSSGGSSGLSDQSSTASIQSTASTYDIGSIDVDEIVELLNGDTVSFTLSGNGYYFVVQELSPIQIKLLISGLSSQVNVKVGEVQQIDITADGIPDISIKLKSVNIITNKAKLILNSI